MLQLEGTETQKNLVKAFLGESGARNRYTFYASIAKKEGYEQISNIFLETAENERTHAKQFLKFLENTKMYEIKGAFPLGLKDTISNLKTGFEGEHEENTVLYPSYAKKAFEEGFYDIAKCFEEIIKVEKHHEARYRALYDNIINKTVFKKEQKVNWVCLKCGNIYFQKEAPDKCDLCHHPKAYFQVLCDNF